MNTRVTELNNFRMFYVRKESYVAALDFVVCATAFYLALRFGSIDAASGEPSSRSVGWQLLMALGYSAIMLIGLIAMGSYPDDHRRIFPGVLLRIAASFLLGTFLLAATFFLLPGLAIDPRTLLTAQGLSLVGITVMRAISLSSAGHGILKRRVLVLGSGVLAQNLAHMERRCRRRGFHIVGFAEFAGNGNENAVDVGRVLQIREPLLSFAARHRIDEIIVAVDDRRGSIPLDELVDCRAAGIQVLDLVAFFEREFGKLRLDLISPSYLIFSEGFQSHTIFTVVKRMSDLILSFTVLAMVWPLMLLTVLAIRLEEGWNCPIIYRQTRVGLNGRLFEILKFRSMRIDAEADRQARWAQVNDSRITRVGAFIRRHRIDELPQLFNVLRGEMSFVGPRPERPEFVGDLVAKIPYYRQRHQVNVGLTGWAQLCYPYGDSEQDAAEKLQYDLYYLKNRSFFLDLLILLKTAEIVLFGKGAR
ncbi:MAG: TIGR03013 family XrtA/PEP-CTERM system glycosyltransferase [Methylotetracoccus sp.]